MSDCPKSGIIRNHTTTAENTRKTRQRQANKVLKIGGILYATDARRMVRDRLELEGKRKKEKEEAWGKRDKLALQKCYKQTKKWRLTENNKRNRNDKRWISVMKELLKYIPMYVE